MDISTAERIKHRELAFSALHPDPDQAGTAGLLLADVEGVLEVRPNQPAPGLLQVRYDLACIRLQLIEELLVELGFHLENSLLQKLKRSLYYYTESAQVESMGWGGDANRTREVFIQRYQRLRHGCRDERPDHWRQYL